MSISDLFVPVILGSYTHLRRWLHVSGRQCVHVNRSTDGTMRKERRTKRSLRRWLIRITISFLFHFEDLDDVVLGCVKWSLKDKVRGVVTSLTWSNCPSCNPNSVRKKNRRKIQWPFTTCSGKVLIETETRTKINQKHHNDITQRWLLSMYTVIFSTWRIPCCRKTRVKQKAILIRTANSRNTTLSVFPKD